MHKPDYSIVVDATGPDEAVRVAVGGELDLAASGPLRDALEAQLGAGRDVVLDLARVEFLDCSGLSAVVAGMEFARARGRLLMIDDNLSEPVRRVADLTSTLDQLLVAA